MNIYVRILKKYLKI